MIKLKNIVSLHKPETMLDNGLIVRIRKRIKSIIIMDEIFNDERKAYMYDEERYDKEEYEDMKLQQEIQSIKEDTKLTQLAIAEILAASENANQAIALNTIYIQYSAIAQMYANMIEKGIYSIDRVPERWKAEVEAVLAENAKQKEED